MPITILINNELLKKHPTCKYLLEAQENFNKGKKARSISEQNHFYSNVATSLCQITDEAFAALKPFSGEKRFWETTVTLSYDLNVIAYIQQAHGEQTLRNCLKYLKWAEDIKNEVNDFAIGQILFISPILYFEFFFDSFPKEFYQIDVS